MVGLADTSYGPPMPVTRYFDLRVLAKHGTFWLTHGLHETRLEVLLDDVARFLGEYE